MNTNTRFLSVLCLLSSVLCLSAFADSGLQNFRSSELSFNNPLTTTRGHPDPFVYKHTDGTYYGLCTFGKADGTPAIGIWRSKDLLELFRTTPKVVWRAPATGWNEAHIWAPEIHHIDNTFYIYYTASTKDKPGPNRRMGVLKCAGPDPFDDPWLDAGRLIPPDADEWAIDPTVLQQNNKLYLIWSGQPAHTDKHQRLYIMPMANPTKLTGKRLELSRPEHPWERQGNHIIKDVNEGPQVLQYAGKTHIIYSASFCGTRHYKLGMLTIASDADPMHLPNWKKSPTPVFQEANALHGPGHCSFTTDASGRHWIIYHARLLPGDDAGLRHVCLQPFSWHPDATPNFGAPRKNNIPVPK
jgi:GH43 family beta-xylosidase